MRYNVKNLEKVKDSRQSLRWLYGQLPATRGCLENIAKSEGGCGAWCCAEMSPSLWYVEFLNSWNYVIHNWTDERIQDLVERCLRKYLYPNRLRGCVFWDSESKLCSQHETRCYNCRLYSIEPEEEFNDRLVKLRVIYPDAKDQCNRVSTESGEKVTKEQTKKWWGRLMGLESSIGVLPDVMHDGFGGSYRHYHDHILMYLFEDDIMEHLSNLRENGNPLEKENCIRNVMKAMSAFVNKPTEKG